MSDRPILFSGAMVRALLDGTKTQTRRAIKPQPAPCNHSDWPQGPADATWTPRDGWHCSTCGNGIRGERHGYTGFPCPYGQPGDRLWVRETWRTDSSLDDRSPRSFTSWPVRYPADGHVGRCGSLCGNTDGKRRPSMFMPRWASRITLDVTAVRIERLQDISEADAIAEGCKALDHVQWRTFVEADAGEPYRQHTARDAYSALWEHINGIGSWDLNPWVWVVEFKRIEGEAHV